MTGIEFTQGILSGLESLHVHVTLNWKWSGQKGLTSRWFGVDALTPRRMTDLAEEKDKEGCEVYLSACPAARAPATNADKCRIRQQDVACIPAYFLDVDTQEDPDKAGKRVPATKADAGTALDALPCPPSVVVDSGHGLHAWWLLKYPAPAESKAQLRAFADAVKQSMCCPDLDAFASEPARLLRMPGTHNHKGGACLPVEVIGGTGKKYDVSTLDDFARGLLKNEQDTTLNKNVQPSTHAAPPVDAHGMLAFIREHDRNGRTSRLLSGDTSGYNSESEADIALCNDLAFWCGGDVDLIDGVFRLSGLMRDKWDRRQSGSTYGRITAQKAARECRNHYGDKHGVEAPGAFAEYEEAYGLAGDTGRVRGYAAIHGVTYQTKRTEEGETRYPLANFTALIRKQELLDDGQEQATQYRLSGVNEQGKRLREVCVTSGEFASMRWSDRFWGAQAIISPGQTVRDKLRYAIQAASMGTCAEETVYTSTGWRLGEKPFFVTAGGAIGRSGARVALEDGLERYSLPVDTDTRAGAAASLKLLEAYHQRISAPLMGFMYLAPLTSFLTEAQCPPSCTLWLAGRTQAGKSMAAGLFLSHFGSGFSSKNPPASFHDSVSSLRRKAYLAQDVPLLIDDYHPIGTRKERDAMVEAAQSMIRGWSNRSDRGRANADQTLRRPMPPRGVGLCTGEDLPDVHESGLARLYVVRVEREDKLPAPVLEERRQDGRNGLYAAAMAGFVDWLLPQAEGLPERLREEWQDLCGNVAARLPDSGGDLTENAAFLLLGLRWALRYFIAQGATDENRAALLWKQAVEAVALGAQEQTRDMSEERPSSIFLSALHELLTTGKARVQPIQAGAPIEYIQPESMIGWSDERMYYLIPGAAYGAVCTCLKEQGSVFPVSRSQLWRNLVEEALVETDNAGQPAKIKKISGKVQRLLWIRRDALDGGEEQEMMEAQ